MITGLRWTSQAFTSLGSDSVISWHLDFFESDSTFVCNDVEEISIFPTIEGYAHTVLASSGCSSTSVDVDFCVLWRLDLNYKLDIWNVKSSRSDICSD